MKLNARSTPLVALVVLLALLFAVGAPAKPQPTGKRPAKFQLVYGPAGEADLEPARDLARATGLFDDIVQGFNDTFALDEDIVVLFANDEEGPYYQAGEIVMSYQFLALHAFLFTELDYVESDEELAEKILNVTEFVLYHELAHALIDAYAIPILGREEDAADNLAAIVATSLDVGEIALVAADAIDMGLELQGGDIDDAEFWDVHSLDEQRMYSAICMVYGSNPKRYRGLLEDAAMPADKREACMIEFEEKRNAWLTVLQPYLKQPLFE